MRFLIFNVAVAGALVYLVTGGKVPVDDMVKRFADNSVVAPVSDRINQEDAVSQQIRMAVADAMAKMRASAPFPPTSSVPPNADKPAVAETTFAKTTPAPRDTGTAKTVVKKTSEPKTDETLKPVSSVRNVGRDPGHVIDPTRARPLAARAETPEPRAKTPIKSAAIHPTKPKVSPEVARRRAEVLAQGPVASAPPQTASTDIRTHRASNVKLEDGAALMTPSERLKELQALSDELEFMYLERRGG